MRKRAYIAGPISKGDLCHNLNQASATNAALAKAGFAPMCPHWSAYSKTARREILTDDDGEQWVAVIAEATIQGNDEISYAEWMEISLSWVGAADALLRLPGESAGADLEVTHAKKYGVPVFTSIESLIAYFA